MVETGHKVFFIIFKKEVPSFPRAFIRVSILITGALKELIFFLPNMRLLSQIEKENRNETYLSTHGEDVERRKGAQGLIVRPLASS